MGSMKHDYLPRMNLLSKRGDGRWDMLPPKYVNKECTSRVCTRLANAG
jgi:hypothetical protein